MSSPNAGFHLELPKFDHRVGFGSLVELAALITLLAFVGRPRLSRLRNGELHG